MFASLLLSVRIFTSITFQGLLFSLQFERLGEEFPIHEGLVEDQVALLGS